MAASRVVRRTHASFIKKIIRGLGIYDPVSPSLLASPMQYSYSSGCSVATRSNRPKIVCVCGGGVFVIMDV